MRPGTAGALLAALAGLALAFPPARAASPGHVPKPLPPPAARDAPGCRPCPRSRRATPATRSRPASTRRSTRSTGALVLEWRNTSDGRSPRFPFHLYWNAFRNNLSTSARGEGRRAPDDRKREDAHLRLDRRSGPCASSATPRTSGTIQT